MKVTMACYEAVSIIRGGPRVQIIETKAELEKLGIEVTLFNPWENSSRLECDLVHLFSANLGTFHLAKNLQTFSVPLVTSPIFFTRRSPWAIRATILLERSLKYIRSGIWTNYGYTKQICDWS